MSPDTENNAAVATELQQLREERGLFIELLYLDRARLRNFMTFAARILTRVRKQLHLRTREPEPFVRKLSRLHELYTQLERRAAALPLPSLAQQLKATARSLDRSHMPAAPTGDALLPALVQIDTVFLSLITIAQRTGIPLIARRAARLHAHLPGTAQSRQARTDATGTPVPQLALALQQLCGQLAEAQGKRIDLTTTGLERVPDDQAGAFYDMLSQMLRNAIEHGIETPAQRSEAGKSARGALLVEFHTRNGGQSELIFQDDGQGLNRERIVQAAVTSGLIRDDASVAQDPRQASTLIFQPGLSTAADNSGRGFGMCILRDNVKRLSGQIQVATKRGQFTRIRIRLPTASAQLVSAHA